MLFGVEIVMLSNGHHRWRMYSSICGKSSHVTITIEQKNVSIKVDKPEK